MNFVDKLMCLLHVVKLEQEYHINTRYIRSVTNTEKSNVDNGKVVKNQLKYLVYIYFQFFVNSDLAMIANAFWFSTRSMFSKYLIYTQLCLFVELVMLDTMLVSCIYYDQVEA